jgi:hypothetical protein
MSTGRRPVTLRAGSKNRAGPLMRSHTMIVAVLTALMLCAVARHGIALLA